MRRFWLLLMLSCAPDLGIGDQLCSSNAECSNGEQCFPVTEVRASTGTCLASSGTQVCRPVCTSCPPPSACGCICP